MELLGKGTVAVTLLPYVIQSCNDEDKTETKTIVLKKIEGISPSTKDDLILIDGLKAQIIISWEDKINQSDYFGFNNDFLCFIPFENSITEGFLWSNHEYLDPLFINGGWQNRDVKATIDKEMYQVGGSILHIKKVDEKWVLVSDSKYNRRLTAQTSIPFNWDEKIANADKAIGTMGNCAGGLTPWGTILTCEENYQDYYGDKDFEQNIIENSTYGWEKFYDYPPEHYGWVVEVDPFTGNAQKHIALGRCAHECATVVQLEDKRLVVYTGDDKNDECLYKFISSQPNSLKEGTLYVANTEKGEWIPIDIESQPALKEKFETQTNALIYLRESSKIVGGTPLDRPEDIEINPNDSSVLVSLTNNIPKENFHGSILKIEEQGGKHDSLKFESKVFLAGGEENGFSCPDNMVFDKKGNLWFTSDISGKYTHGDENYKSFGNNGLFLVLKEGEQAGEVIQVASAPVDAELTGPWFSPDGKTLFLSVQHPGETSKSMDTLTSHWPNGNNEIPRPSVVAISGEFMDDLLS